MFGTSIFSTVVASDRSPQKRAIGVNLLEGIDWNELRRAYATFIGNPTQGILHILAAGRHSNWRSRVEARLAKQGAHLRHAELSIDIPQLLELPADTLGGAYARHIVSQGFDPDAFRRSDRDSETWMERRLSLSHDVHHVILGFDGSPVGEFGLAAFVFVQFRDLLNTFVLSHVPYFLLGHPHLFVPTIKAIARGWRMGKRCRPIFAYPFEANWHVPLVRIRQELGI